MTVNVSDTAKELIDALNKRQAEDKLRAEGVLLLHDLLKQRIEEEETKSRKEEIKAKLETIYGGEVPEIPEIPI